MIDASFRAKISDFGLSSKRMVTGMAGSPFWMAPELLNGGKHSPATDVYAYGILVRRAAPPKTVVTATKACCLSGHVGNNPTEFS